MSSSPPAEYLCPLSRNLMHDPMLTRYGNHFERKAIMEWFNAGNTFCPVTGNPLRPSNLISDKTLKWKIRYWATKNGLGHEFEESPSDDDSTGHADDLLLGGTVAIPHKHFLCPLTKDIMIDPVMSKTGQNFERKAILQWLDKNGDVCPVTGEELTPSGVVANGKLQWEINQWQLHVGDSSKEMTRLELESKLSKAEMVSRDFQLSDILHALTETSAASGNAAATVAEEKPLEKEGILSMLDEVVDTIDI